MNYDPAIHHRRSIRLQGYDYSRSGAYFITICTQGRRPLFGRIIEDAMQLNEAGEMICRWYLELENKFPDIHCDAFICMPNHVHFIVVNFGLDLRDHPNDESVGRAAGEHPDFGLHSSSPLYSVVQWFKTMTTNEYIRGVKQHCWFPFSGKMWQRNYWERIVRNENELNNMREYIHNNPAQWAADKLNFAVVGRDGTMIREAAAAFAGEIWMV